MPRKDLWFDFRDEKYSHFILSVSGNDDSVSIEVACGKKFSLGGSLSSQNNSINQHCPKCEEFLNQP